MKIIGLNHQQSGCGYHRVLLPLGFMDGIKGYVTNIITEEAVEDYDILLYNRISSYDTMWDTIREQLNCKVVLDLDDYWRLPFNHLNYNQYQNMYARIEANIQNADMVTVTNFNLAEKVLEFRDDVNVLPNGLPYGLNQFHDTKIEDARVRIFWAGSVTHEYDMEILRQPIQRLKQYKDKIKMVIAGYNDTDPYTKSIWQRMFSAFTAGGQLPYMKVHSTAPTQYMDAYANADIMLIPLEHSEWHSCKSNLNILEAAAKRIPCVVSNVAPYNFDADCPVFWVNSQKDWFTHLSYLINNKAEREAAGEALYQWALANYNLKDINEKRFNAFESICGASAYS